MRGIVVAVLAGACTPAWVDEGYAPTARRDAIRAAARDHGCPVERVQVRCDATAAAAWLFELDVCGHVRRYGHEPERGEFVERAVECARGACLEVAPPCRGVARGMWWAVARVGPPDVCAEARVDDRLAVDVVARRLEVVFGNAGRRPHQRWLGASCREPSVVVGVDDAWFAVCGDRRDGLVEIPPGGHRIATGLGLAAGTRGVEVFHVARDELGTRCHRSPPLAVDVRAATPVVFGADRQ